MSRSSRTAAAALGLALVLGVGSSAGAATEPGPGAPVLDIVAPVLDISFATADIAGAARVEEKPRQVRVTLASEVLFGKDSARLRATSRSRLREVAQTLGDRGPGSVSIVGYTDDLGSAAYGLDLSRRRAASVSRALRPLLDKADFPFAIKGMGEADPAVPNDSEANRKLNRRVVLTYRAAR